MVGSCINIFGNRELIRNVLVQKIVKYINIWILYDEVDSIINLQKGLSTRIKNDLDSIYR